MAERKGNIADPAAHDTLFFCESDPVPKSPMVHAIAISSPMSCMTNLHRHEKCFLVAVMRHYLLTIVVSRVATHLGLGDKGRIGFC